MRTVTVIAATVFSLLLAGCGTTHTSHTDTPTPSSSTGASVGDAMFAQMMIPHHQQAVEMSALADTRTSNPEVLALADEIEAAQLPEIEQMTEWLTEWGVPVPSSASDMDAHAGHGMKGMLTEEQLTQLANSREEEFDRLFAEFMILHHEGAIEMAEGVVGSQEPRVKSLATNIIETQNEEIGRLRALLQ